MLIQNKKNGFVFCFKKIKKETILNNYNKGNSILKELFIARHINNVNVVKFLETYETEKNIIIVMEHIEGEKLTNLPKVFYKKSKNIFSIFMQLVNVLNIFNQYGIMHRNLCPDNILITSNNGEYLDKIKKDIGEMISASNLDNDKNDKSIDDRHKMKHADISLDIVKRNSSFKSYNAHSLSNMDNSVK